MPLRAQLTWRALLVLICATLQVLQVSAAQDEPAGAVFSSSSGDPQNTVWFSDSGGICSWRLALDDKREIETLDGCDSKLLDLRVTIDNADVSDRMEWSRQTGSGEWPVLFSGVDEQTGLQVRRSYSWKSGAPALRHSLQIELAEGIVGRDVQVAIRSGAAPKHHVMNDRSLGDFFYGYSRVFARSDLAEIERVDTEVETHWAGIATRHTALVLDLGEAHPDARIMASAEPGIDGQLRLIADFRGAAAGTLGSSVVDLAMLPLTPALASQYGVETMLYSDALLPFRYLSRLIDWILVGLSALLGNVGVAVIVLAVLVRAVFFRVTTWSMEQQDRFSAAEVAMRPAMEEIKRTSKGEKRSERMLSLYKEHGISPFSGLKGSAALFVQIPILICLFNVTAESAVFRDASFLWMSDLSLPDQLALLPFVVPLFGASLNLLPIALGAVNLFSGSLEAKREPTASSRNRTALIFTILILVFFYSCSAALVLYWLAVNLTQMAERRFLRRKAA